MSVKCNFHLFLANQQLNKISILQSVFTNCADVHRSHSCVLPAEQAHRQLCHIHNAVNSFTSSMQPVPENSLHHHHGISLMSEKKNAREIILHPVRLSRLPISRYCCEKCFDKLKRLKGGRIGSSGAGRRTKRRKQRSKH